MRRDWGTQELQRAVDDAEFVLHYQPIVSLASGTVEGVEALLRWRHPDHGTIAADAFIGSVTRSGLLQQLLPQIVNAACETAVRLNSELGGDPFVAFNLDPHQLTTDPVIQLVEAALENSGAKPDSLVIEVTERADVLDQEATLSAVHRLRGLGVQLAIDDFGTGHSSLTRIKQFPAGKVKIDRSFVLDVVDDRDDQTIVASVALLADGLGLECVAEGVERQDQATVLADLGCNAGQGFLWSAAVPAAEVSETIRRADRAAIAAGTRSS